MTFGLGFLRLAPATFWSMTPRELAAASRVVGTTQSVAIERSALAQLMQLYPDEGS